MLFYYAVKTMELLNTKTITKELKNKYFTGAHALLIN